MNNHTDRTKRAEVRMRKKVVADILDSVPEYIKKVRCDTTPWTQPFKCAVISCRNVFQKHDPNNRHRFHNFPADPELCQLWIHRCRVKEDFNINSAKVCSDHFLPGDYERNFKEELTNPAFKCGLKSSAVPTQLLEGVEVALVDFLSEEGVCEVPNSTDVKRTVDENVLLQEKLNKLLAEKNDLHLKHAELERKLTYKRKKVKSVKAQCYKITEKTNYVKQQKNLLNHVFSQSQINVLLGKRKVVWSNDDMAMAFTLRQMGNKDCYLYLKNILNIPLPSLSSVQRWAASK